MYDDRQEILSSNGDRSNQEVIESALRSLPLADAPPDFTAGVLARIELVAPVRFRLTWLDFGLCGFTGVMLLVFFIVVQWLPPYLDLYLHLEALNWASRLATMPWLPLASVSMALLGFASALAAGLWFVRYGVEIRKPFDQG